MPDSQHQGDEEVIESWASLKGRIHTLSTLFTSQTLRPSIPKPPTQNHSRPIQSGVLTLADLPDLDRMTPEGLVNDLNSMVAAASRNVTEEVSRLIIEPLVC